MALQEFSSSRFFNQLGQRSTPAMKRKLFLIAALAVFLCAGAAAAQTPQEKEASRNATREKLRQLLATSGPKKGIGIDFRQSDKQPYNFVGVKRDGLVNSDAIEIVIGVTNDETIGFRTYPHIKSGYINPIRP